MNHENQNCPSSHGAILMEKKFEDFSILKTLHKPELQIPWHSHSRPCITFVFNGGYNEIYKNKEYECHPFSIHLKPVDEWHKDIYGKKGAKSLVVVLEEKQLAFLKGLEQLKGHSYLNPGESLYLGTRLYNEFHIQDETSPLILDGIIREIIGLGVRKNSNRREKFVPFWLKSIKDKIGEEYLEKITIHSLAKSANVHPDHLSRNFRKTYGIFIGDYIRCLRLGWAQNVLLQTNRDLTDIALEAGFSDQSHFTRTFKKHFGLTPGQFRRLVR